MSITRPSSDEPGYTGGRNLTEYIVKDQEISEDGTFVSISTTDSTGFGCDPEVGLLLTPGTVFELETKGFSMITGFKVNGFWVQRKTDEDLEIEHQKFREDWLRKNEERYQANKDEWQKREDALPDWIKERIATFHERGGDSFKREGWGYELCIAELAVLYADQGYDAIRDSDQFSVVDSEAIHEYASEMGTSGNQHGAALSLAKAHLRGQSLAGTVGGLTPINGDPFYEGKETE